MEQQNKKHKRSYAGLWIILVAAIVLELTACIQYVYSRAGIRAEAEQRARSELRRAELEINVVTAQLEAAVQMLAMLAEKHVDSPDAIAVATCELVSTLQNVHSAGVAYEADYFPQQGRWFEICSSRETKDGESYVYTRQIGGQDHDYLQTEWFANGMTIDSCCWSEPYYDNSGARAMVVSCSYPIRNAKGEKVAVALVDLSLEYLQTFSDYLQVYKDSYYSIVSSKGLHIVTPPDTIPGKKYRIFDEEIDATGWHITIIIPDDVIFANLKRIGLLVLLMMLLGLGLLIFIVYRAGRDVVRLVDSTAARERMENELSIARSIQMAMVPKSFPPFPDRLNLDIYGLVNPAKEVGGDLYDFYLCADKLFFCIGDVSGKGVPAALVMATIRSLFRSIAPQEEGPATIMGRMNDVLAEQNGQNMFVTLFLGILDMKTGRLAYCNAGHNAPILDGTQLEVVPNLPLGVVAGLVYQSQTIELKYGQLLFLYTDGLTEAENGAQHLYGEERMLSVLQGITNNRPRNVVETMQRDVEAFVDGAEQSDDLTMMAIRYQIPAIVFRNDIQQIPTLAEWIEGLNLPQELDMPVNLALEEAVSNVMLYAYPGKQDGQVLVEFARTSTPTGEKIVFTISDTGIPFDPTKKEEVDITLSFEQRAIGGLGIHLVRQLMDEMEYKREGDKNVLTLIKSL